ncbi:hypothetical protein IWX65_003179 [Arthrobacter sp. CAN_A214]|uniref:hypothetical protein n=1 Tax=Arthrobacter sp. CAN_A214 TaxID=2787720 RepID=UPI0018CBDD30
MAVGSGAEFFGFSILIVPVLWLILGFIMYGIIRFGVKHGMRSYYAEAARRPGPTEGSAGNPLR